MCSADVRRVLTGPGASSKQAHREMMSGLDGWYSKRARPRVNMATRVQLKPRRMPGSIARATACRADVRQKCTAHLTTCHAFLGQSWMGKQQAICAAHGEKLVQPRSRYGS